MGGGALVLELVVFNNKAGEGILGVEEGDSVVGDGLLFDNGEDGGIVGSDNSWEVEEGRGCPWFP